MAFVTRVLLESPFLLAILAFLLFGATLFARQRMESQAARRQSIPVILLIIVAMFVAQGLVETDREVISGLIEVFAAAIEAGDVGQAGLLISDEFDGEGEGRGEFIERLEGWLSTVDIRGVQFQRREAVVLGKTATLKLAARATVRIRGQPGVMHWGAWKIDWIRSAEGWRITRIAPEMIDGRSIDSLRALEGYLD